MSRWKELVARVDWGTSDESLWTALSEVSTERLVERGWKKSPLAVGDLTIPVNHLSAPVVVDWSLRSSTSRDVELETVTLDQCQVYVMWNSWAIGFELTGGYHFWFMRASAVDARWSNPAAHIVRCGARFNPHMVTESPTHPVFYMNELWSELPNRARKELT